MNVRLTALDPRVWVKNGSNIQQLGIFNKLNAGVFLIDPAQISSLGGSKSTQLSDANFLSLRLTPSMDLTASASSHLNSSWSSNGWTVGDIQTFLTELKTWCENHFGVSAINPISADVNLVLMQGKISNDSENSYTVAIAYFGNKGIAIGGALPVEGDILLHLDAASITGVSNGGSVSTWTPVAGTQAGAWTATTGAGFVSPTLVTSGQNGLPAVRFSQIACGMYGPGTALMDGHNTVFAVLNKLTLTTGSYKTSNYFLSQDCESFYGYNYRLSLPNDNKFYSYVVEQQNGETIADWSMPTQTTPNTPHLIGIRYNRGTAREWAQIDGGAFTQRGTLYSWNAVSPVTYQDPTGFGKPGGIAGTGTPRLALGRDSRSVATWSFDPFVMEVSELIIYNRALTDEEFAAVRSYLNTKYNLGYV